MCIRDSPGGNQNLHGSLELEMVGKVRRKFDKSQVPPYDFEAVSYTHLGKEAGVPRVSDLRDSGSIEQDADQIMLRCV